MKDKIGEVLEELCNKSMDNTGYAETHPQDITQARQQLCDVLCGEIEKLKIKGVRYDKGSNSSKYQQGYNQSNSDNKTLIKQLLLTPGGQRE